ncbi:MAG: hypothetical protein ISS46_02995 [Candidatus Omnitrophica bacterium]|nr:hypothetical protein [Candidatus Omnitrophota bacterium]
MKNKGVVFIVALIVVAIMSANLVLFSTVIMRNCFNARKEVDLLKALYVAEAGANMALRELQEGEDGDISQTVFGDGTYEVNTTGGVVVSTGIVKGRTTVVRLNIYNPKAAFGYGVFTDGIQEYRGGGAGASIVVNGNVHSNNAAPHINSSHLIVSSGYTVEAGPDYGFPNLDIAYYRTIVPASRHYVDGDILSNITLPQAKDAVTLVELTGDDAGEDISINNSSGNGILIVIGGNVVMSGTSSFTGLLYVNDSNMDGTGEGGNVRIGGSASVTGAVVSRTVNTIHGTSSVTYDPSAFSIDGLQVDTDKITVYSWQSS